MRGNLYNEITLDRKHFYFHSFFYSNRDLKKKKKFLYESKKFSETWTTNCLTCGSDFTLNFIYISPRIKPVYYGVHKSWMKVLEWDGFFFLLCVRFRLFVNKCGYCLFIWAVDDSFYYFFSFIITGFSLYFQSWNQNEPKIIGNRAAESKSWKRSNDILQHRMFYCSVVHKYMKIFCVVFRMISSVKQLNDCLLNPPLRSKRNSNNNWPLL